LCVETGSVETLCERMAIQLLVNPLTLQQRWQKNNFLTMKSFDIHVDYRIK
jgi:hypothetical protein